MTAGSGIKHERDDFPKDAAQPPLSPCSRWRSGQALTEYAILAAIIAIGVIVTVSLFGEVVLGVFAQLGSAMKQDGSTPDKAAVEDALSAMNGDAAIARNMRNFDQEAAGTPPPGPSSSPPSRPAPQGYAGTHHLGNSGEPGTISSYGNVINEGLSYQITFALTPEMINYANCSGNGSIDLSFSAGNHVGDYNNYINNEGVNAVLLDGQTVGHAANGCNAVSLNVGGLGPGLHTVTFTSGNLDTTRDDFNVSDIVIGASGG